MARMNGCCFICGTTDILITISTTIYREKQDKPIFLSARNESLNFCEEIVGGGHSDIRTFENPFPQTELAYG